MTEEAKKVIELVRQLNIEQTIEFLYMLKGAVFIAKEQKGV